MPNRTMLWNILAHSDWEACGQLPVARSGDRPQRSVRPQRSRTRAACTTTEDKPYARVTFTAQNLNSGILPNGSSCSVVRLLAAASRKWNGTKTQPGSSESSLRT